MLERTLRLQAVSHVVLARHVLANKSLSSKSTIILIISTMGLILSTLPRCDDDGGTRWVNAVVTTMIVRLTIPATSPDSCRLSLSEPVELNDRNTRGWVITDTVGIILDMGRTTVTELVDMTDICNRLYSLLSGQV